MATSKTPNPYGLRAPAHNIRSCSSSPRRSRRPRRRSDGGPPFQGFVSRVNHREAGVSRRRFKGTRWPPIGGWAGGRTPGVQGRTPATYAGSLSDAGGHNERRRAEYAAQREAEHEAARKTLTRDRASRFAGTANATSSGERQRRDQLRRNPTWVVQAELATGRVLEFRAGGAIISICPRLNERTAAIELEARDCRSRGARAHGLDAGSADRGMSWEARDHRWYRWR